MTRQIKSLIIFCLVNTSFLAGQSTAAITHRSSDGYWTRGSNAWRANYKNETTQSRAHAQTGFFDTENVFEGFWYVGVGVGRSWYRMDSDNFINPGPGWPNDHYFKNSIHDSSFLEANAGYALVRNEDWFPAVSLGLRYDYSFNGKVSGFINQYNLEQFKNYSYSYKFKRQTLLAMFKLDIVKYNCFMPFVLAGVGASYNTGSNYVELPLINVTPRISPGYGSDTTYNFSYIVGAGIDYAFRDDMWATLEYNYGDFGKVRTDNGQITPSLTGLDYSTQHLTNKIKANTLLVSFTYLLNYV